PAECTTREVVEAAQRGDTAVLNVLGTCGEAIAAATAPLVDLLGPDVITLAGPIFEVPRVLDVVSRELHHSSFVGRMNGVRVLAPSLGRDVGLIGAASLVYDRLLAG
ncbi:MAG: ROK family protein, partial [Armatimonadetes bacterium]|nr:ROK family protein [Armatimonadota bacterium]